MDQLIGRHLSEDDYLYENHYTNIDDYNEINGE